MKRNLFWFIIILSLFVASNVFAIQIKINVYDATRHNRFLSGYSTLPVENPGFIASSYDWSGVGWDSTNSNKSVALISPQHFVCANHYRLNENVTFLNQSGQLKTYGIDKYSTFSFTASDGEHVSDLALGWLDSPILEIDNINY
ncbi:MAG: hypothetical protein KAJ14_01945 [Candidatus Omnitrophica bacterium]|nr:hypothetical protein [Candidatus Omnitrophota bacterium]MCK5591157.1 hypothetical protein [Candidatus Paceibacterota bacterium]